MINYLSSAVAEFTDQRVTSAGSGAIGITCELHGVHVRSGRLPCRVRWLDFSYLGRQPGRRAAVTPRVPQSPRARYQVPGMGQSERSRG
jgi:hypothetical protein